MGKILDIAIAGAAWAGRGAFRGVEAVKDVVDLRHDGRGPPPPSATMRAKVVEPRIIKPYSVGKNRSLDDPYGIITDEDGIHLFEPGTPKTFRQRRDDQDKPLFNEDGTPDIEEVPGRKRTNNLFRRGPNDGYTLTAKAWRHILGGRVGAKYTTMAHQEQDPTRREYLFCNLLGVRFKQESKFFKGLIEDIETQIYRKENPEGVQISQGGTDPEIQKLKDQRDELQRLYKKIALSDKSGKTCHDQQHFNKEWHRELLDSANRYLTTLDTKLKAEKDDELKSTQRRIDFLRNLQLLAEEEEAKNDGKYKRAKNPEEIAREFFCDPSVMTFGGQGGVCIRVGDDYHVFGSDENVWSKAFNEMLRFAQDRGTDPWAALIYCEGPEYFQEWFRAECRKNSTRWWPDYDEAFFIYGDLVPMVANQVVQMIPKGYWTETIILTDKDGTMLVDENGFPRTFVQLMHDPDQCDAFGVPKPKTHLAGFAVPGMLPKDQNEPYVYQPYAFSQKSKAIRLGGFIPHHDNGLKGSKAFDINRLYESHVVHEFKFPPELLKKLAEQPQNKGRFREGPDGKTEYISQQGETDVQRHKILMDMVNTLVNHEDMPQPQFQPNADWKAKPIKSSEEQLNAFADRWEKEGASPDLIQQRLGGLQQAEARLAAIEEELLNRNHNPDAVREVLNEEKKKLVEAEIRPSEQTQPVPREAERQIGSALNDNAPTAPPARPDAATTTTKANRLAQRIAAGRPGARPGG